jgi:hypothetical protein
VDYWLWGDDLLRWKWTNGCWRRQARLRWWGCVYTLTGRRSVALAVGLAFTLWQTGFAPPIPLWVGFGRWRQVSLPSATGRAIGVERVVWGALAFALVVEWGFIG